MLPYGRSEGLADWFRNLYQYRMDEIMDKIVELIIEKRGKDKDRATGLIIFRKLNFRRNGLIER